jgi:all-beta uncharacterized protein/BACON domain-containing protein
MIPLARLGVLLVSAALFSASSCGGTATSTSVVGPSGERCGVTVKSSTPALPASGGTGNLTVDTARECAWSARADAAWVTLSGTQGQGPATLAYSVAPNPIGLERRAAVVVSDQHVDIVQEAAPCAFDVAERRKDVASIGGDVTVSLSGTEGCTWTAKSNADWVGQAAPMTGNGSAAIRFLVTANPGEGRSGTVTVAGITVTIVQAPSTSPGPDPPPVPTPDPGPPSPFPPGPAPQPCSYSITPVSQTVRSDATDTTVDVRAPSSCTWTSVSEAAWIAIVNGDTGAGNGRVRLRIAANPGPARTGTVRIAGQTFTVQQGGSNCVVDRIKPTYYDAGRGPDDITINVTAPASCTWTVTNVPTWVSVAEGSTGTGSGRVRLLVDPNFGSARSATIVIGGQPFSLTQNQR